MIRILSFFLLIAIVLTSCDKDEIINDTLIFPVKIVTSSSETTPPNKILRVTYENESSIDVSIEYNTIITIELDDKSNTFFFYFEDEKLGIIELHFTKEELSTYNKDNPLVLEFGAHLSEVIFTSNVNTPEGGNIDMVVELFETTLYHVDWGDGTEDTKKTPRSIGTFANDYLDHKYLSQGNFTITVKATSRKDVKGITLNAKVTNKPAVNLGIQINELYNLETLSLGYNKIDNIDETIAQLPNLKELGLRFGRMTSIDLSKNPNLEYLLLNSSTFNEIKGLYSLNKLTFLGLKTNFNNIELSHFPTLEFLNLYGNNLKQIDLSKNTKLNHLNLGLNSLTNLDLSQNPDLTSLYINYNSFYTYNRLDLDISHLDKIEYLDLSSIGLEVINFPASFTNIKSLNLERYSRSLIPFLNLLYSGQASNPRKNVKIVFKKNSPFSNEHIANFETLKKDHDWQITY